MIRVFGHVPLVARGLMGEEVPFPWELGRDVESSGITVCQMPEEG